MTSTQDQLAEYEAIIAEDPTAFADVGRALAAIRDHKLYPQTNFEAYASQRWNIQGRRAHQFIVSARTSDELAAAGLPVPAVEFQARTLAYMPADIRQQVWLKALDLSGGKPSVSYIDSARRALDAAAASTTAPEKTGRRNQQRPQAAALRSGIASLGGLCAGLDGIDQIDPTVTKEEAAQWVRDLSNSLRVLRSLTTKLKEHSPC